MKPIHVLWILGLLMYAATAFTNIGIVALDDYEYGVARVVPAQNQKNADIIADVGIRSPVPSLVLVSLSRLALQMGIDDPAWQLRFVLVFLGIFSYSLTTLFAFRHFKLGGSEEPLPQAVIIFFIGFYFLCPFFYTRTLIESLSAPFLIGSAYFACEYWVKKRSRSLALSVFWLMLASLFRFQAGVCFFAILSVFLVSRRWKDLGVFAVACAAAFLIPGLLDLWLRGKFHASLLGYVAYNLAHSSSYGVTPFYSFALLFLGISIPPVFLLRYRGMRWREEFFPLLPSVGFFLVFLIAHSLVPHKEERFMVPIIPVFLVCLTPLACYVMTRSRWRTIYFVTVNTILLVLASFNIAQYNTIGLVMYLGTRPDVSRVVGVEDTLVLFPRAFAKSCAQEEVISIADFLKAPPKECKKAIAVRSSLKTQLPVLQTDYKKVAEFKPGFLEQLVVYLNPKQNARRGTIELFEPKSCS